MKFSCTKTDLQNAITLCQKAVSNKTPMAILEGIFFQAYDNRLVLNTTDLEISIKTEIPAFIEVDGEIVLKAGLISDIVRHLPGEDVFFEKDDLHQLKIDCLQASFTIKGQSAEEFPDFPEIEEAYSFQIKAGVLKNMIRGVISSVADNENIPILKGVKTEIQENEIKMVALDGYRLAIRKGEIETPIASPISVIVPGKALNELNRLMVDEEELVLVRFSGAQIYFKVGPTEFVTRLLEGDYFNYEQIIPKEKNNDITIERQDFLAAVERAALLARVGKNNLIKMDFNENQLQITSNADLGDVFETVPIDNIGTPMRIAFNSKYVIDALKVIEEERLRIHLTTAAGPAVLRTTETDEEGDFLYLILPVRMSDL